MKQIKKVTRKGCKNVQLVRVRNEFDADYHWEIQKIHKDKPATYVTNKVFFVQDMLNGGVKYFTEKITKFPYSNPLLKR